jgi:hypothetical protein
MAVDGPTCQLAGGRGRQLCPRTSDVDFLGHLNGVFNFDAEIANGALNLGVAEQELDSAQPRRPQGPGQAARSSRDLPQEVIQCFECEIAT